MSFGVGSRYAMDIPDLLSSCDGQERCLGRKLLWVKQHKIIPWWVLQDEGSTVQACTPCTQDPQQLSVCQTSAPSKYFTTEPSAILCCAARRAHDSGGPVAGYGNWCCLAFRFCPAGIPLPWALMHFFFYGRSTGALPPAPTFGKNIPAVRSSFTLSN